MAADPHRMPLIKQIMREETPGRAALYYNTTLGLHLSQGSPLRRCATFDKAPGGPPLGQTPNSAQSDRHPSIPLWETAQTGNMPRGFGFALFITRLGIHLSVTAMHHLMSSWPSPLTQICEFASCDLWCDQAYNAYNSDVIAARTSFFYISSRWSFRAQELISGCWCWLVIKNLHATRFTLRHGISVTSIVSCWVTNSLAVIHSYKADLNNKVNKRLWFSG